MSRRAAVIAIVVASCLLAPFLVSYAFLDRPDVRLRLLSEALSGSRGMTKAGNGSGQEASPILAIDSAWTSWQSSDGPPEWRLDVYQFPTAIIADAAYTREVKRLRGRYDLTAVESTVPSMYSADDAIVLSGCSEDTKCGLWYFTARWGQYMVAFRFNSGRPIGVEEFATQAATVADHIDNLLA